MNDTKIKESNRYFVILNKVMNKVKFSNIFSLIPMFVIFRDIAINLNPDFSIKKKKKSSREEAKKVKFIIRTHI